MRLDKYLADMGMGSRSDLKKAIRGGKVLLNGQVERDPGAKVTRDDSVIMDGVPVAYEACEYYMLNKPPGVISASEDPSQKTVVDLLDARRRKDLFPVGRLDKDTEGLLLITNDGQLAHRLLAPGKHVDKVYQVRVEGSLSDTDVRAFAEGLRVDDSLTALPARLSILSSGTVSEAEVTIHEGKFHQIKRMFAALGKEVVYLKRMSMGPLVLDPALAPGESRKLTPEEIAMLKGKL